MITNIIYNQKILIFVLITIDMIVTTNGQNVPKFCETSHFDGIYNYGTKLQIKSIVNNKSRWLWTYNTNTMTFDGPPKMEDNSREGLWLLIVT
jgi:hypothetical protein